MKYFTFVLGAILVAYLSVGCNQNPHKTRMNTTDSLQTVVNELNAVFDSVDYDRHFANRKNMMEDISRIEGHFKAQNDTMPRDLAMSLSDYRLVWKGYKRMEGEYQGVEKELQYTDQQLKTLKTDLENNAVNEPQAERFLQEEKEAVSRLEINTRAFSKKMKRTEQKYQDQKPVMSQLADSLENSIE